MKFAWLIFLAFQTAAYASGNGSSGTGNQKAFVGGGAFTIMPSGNSIVKKGDQLMDAQTGEALIQVQTISKDDLKKYGSNLVKSQLGQVQGFEYLPDHKNADTETNLWIYCQGESCTKLSPLSNTNVKVQDIVGGLRLERR